MKNDKFTKERMKFYTDQIAQYCDMITTCTQCVFRDNENMCCGLTGSNDKNKAPYTWVFE